MDRSKIIALGGSDIAAILGLSPWQSARGLYLHLTGEVPAQQDNDVLERGRLLEPVVADNFAVNHPEFEVAEHGIVEDEECPFLIGSPDRVLLQDGELVSVLECKTSDISKMNEWGAEHTDAIPPYYAVQALWYAGLCGVQDVHVAVGFVRPGTRAVAIYKEYYIQYNPDRFNAMKEEAIAFWNNFFVPRILPPITMPDNNTIRHLKDLDRVKDKEMYADEPLTDQVAELIEASAKLKETEKDVELKKIQILDKLGDSEILLAPDGQRLISYKGFETSTVDYKKLLNDLAISDSVVEQYKQRKQSRRFCILAK